MINLKTETIRELRKRGHKPSDVIWVGCENFEIPVDLFWKLADVNYDNGYGANEVPEDLIVCGNNWWLERHEYDGAEWWEYKTLHKRPVKTEIVTTVFCAYLREGLIN